MKRSIIIPILLIPSVLFAENPLNLITIFRAKNDAAKINYLKTLSKANHRQPIFRGYLMYPANSNYYQLFVTTSTDNESKDFDKAISQEEITRNASLWFSGYGDEPRLEMFTPIPGDINTP